MIDNSNYHKQGATAKIIGAVVMTVKCRNGPLFFLSKKKKDFSAEYGPYWSDSCPHVSQSSSSTVASLTAAQGHTILLKRST
jgi:hypothetical protein